MDSQSNRVIVNMSSIMHDFPSLNRKLWNITSFFSFYTHSIIFVCFNLGGYLFYYRTKIYCDLYWDYFLLTFSQWINFISGDFNRGSVRDRFVQNSSYSRTLHSMPSCSFILISRTPFNVLITERQSIKITGTTTATTTTTNKEKSIRSSYIWNKGHCYTNVNNDRSIAFSVYIP